MSEALRQLHIDGYVILPGLLSSSQVEQIKGALTPLLARQPWARGEFFGSRTRRLHNVLAKTRATDDLVNHPAVVELVRAVLGHPQVSIVNAIEIHPGETAQPFHQDDVLFPIARPHPPLIVNTMWAITEFTRENGATVLVPKSQDLAALPETYQSVSAEMDPGSVLLWNGGLFHGGGANHSVHARLGLNVNYNCAWLRQQENQYLAIPRETARELPDDILRLIGYDAFLNIYGLVDHAHPLGVLGRPVQLIDSAGGGNPAATAPTPDGPGT
ncbi:phytanoyl-CoA dioxygenase family protein [Mycobacterium botniense]|nr:phytanoyl-CoA dioxygenase family protein [Mycobacterium botniense]